MSFTNFVSQGLLQKLGAAALVAVLAVSGFSSSIIWAQDRDKKPPANVPLAKPDIPLSPSDKPMASGAVVAPARPSEAATTATKPALSVVRPATAITAGNVLSTKSGVKFEDTVVGTGNVAQMGQTVKVHYTGWLLDGKSLGKKFDSSVDRNQTFQFKLGEGRVIKGWEEGIVGMKVGGTRVLTVPPEAAYGQAAVGTAIPAGSTLVFEVRLMAN
jgi:peptidylprolyl isomerase